MTKFSDFKLTEEIQQALAETGFEQPTPVQEKVIPQLLRSPQDLIALAQTGTGKTAAYSLPVLTQMDLNNRNVQTIVLSPTRELAMQIAKDIKTFSKHVKGLRTVAVFGGSPIYEQIRELKRGAHVVVGTPGRVLDLINRNILKLKNVKWAILDEADEMLNMGFVEDISSILSNTPAEKQTLLFSATMSRTIERIAGNYMRKPMRIELKADKDNQLAISHQFMMVPSRDKVKAFKRYRAMHPEMYAILFCRTRRECQEIGDALLKDGYPTGVLHGEIEQKHRTRIMDAFKRKDTTLLVATDVAARGIDVSKLTHVIHVGVPDKVESYTHRSGRTGRANEKGISMVLAHLREHRALKRIEQVNKIKFEQLPVPKREDMIEADLARFVERIESDEKPSDLAKKYVNSLLHGIPSEEMEQVARKVLLMAVEQSISKFPEEDMDKKGGQRRGQMRGGTAGMKTLVISEGRKSKLTVPQLLKMINEVTQGDRVDVGHIQLGDKKSSFEVPIEFVEKLCRNMSEHQFRGKSVIVKEGTPVERSGPPPRGGHSRRPHRGNSRGSNSRGSNSKGGYSKGPQKRRKARRY